MADLGRSIPYDCDQPLHPIALAGFRLFNAGEYWHAHEALEAAWKDEPGGIRYLYQGILQVGVAYLHVQRHNYRGAVKVFLRSQRLLLPFPEVCRGIAVEQLRQDAGAVLNEIRRLGSSRIAEFDLSMLKPLTWE